MGQQNKKIVKRARRKRYMARVKARKIEAAQR
jgi:hypothetical protein